MKFQIDENVNSILADFSRQFVIAERTRVQPAIRIFLKPAGYPVNSIHLCIAEDFKLLVVVVGQERIEEKSRRMIPEIRRNIPHAKPSLRISFIGVRHDSTSQRLAVTLVPDFQFVINDFGVGLVIVEAIHQIAVKIRHIGPEFHGTSIGGDRFRQPAHVLERTAEIVPGRRVIRSELQSISNTTAAGSGLLTNRKVQPRLFRELKSSGLRSTALANAAAASADRVALFNARPRL